MASGLAPVPAAIAAPLKMAPAAGGTAPAVRAPTPTKATDTFWAAPNVMSQYGYTTSLGNWGTPGSGGLYDFMNNWATKGVGGIKNPNGSDASYAQVMMDLQNNRGIDTSGLPSQAYSGPTAEQISGLDSATANQFNAQRGGVRSAYDTLMAQLGQQEAMTNQNQNDTLRNYGTQTQQGREALPGGYVGRGIFKSGIYGQGLSDFVTNRQQGESNIRSQYAQLLQQIAGQKSGAANQMDTALAQIAADEQARKAAQVADLKRYGIVSS